MKRLVCILLLVLWIGPVYAEDGEGHPLTVDDIFPSDRVLDVQITVDPGDWDTVRFQERGFLDTYTRVDNTAPLTILILM